MANFSHSELIPWQPPLPPPLCTQVKEAELWACLQSRDVLAPLRTDAQLGFGLAFNTAMGCLDVARLAAGRPDCYEALSLKQQDQSWRSVALYNYHVTQKRAPFLIEFHFWAMLVRQVSDPPWRSNSFTHAHARRRARARAQAYLQRAEGGFGEQSTLCRKSRVSIGRGISHTKSRGFREIATGGSAPPRLQSPTHGQDRAGRCGVGRCGAGRGGVGWGGGSVGRVGGGGGPELGEAGRCGA